MTAQPMFHDAGDELELDPRALELEQLCACGHDRGDHLVDAPHACEPCSCACFRPEAS
jgi:hypothetical protein